MKKSHIVLILAFLVEIYFVYYWWKDPSEFIFVLTVLIINALTIIDKMKEIRLAKNRQETNSELEKEPKRKRSRRILSGLLAFIILLQFYFSSPIVAAEEISESSETLDSELFEEETFSDADENEDSVTIMTKVNSDVFIVDSSMPLRRAKKRK